MAMDATEITALLGVVGTVVTSIVAFFQKSKRTVEGQIKQTSIEGHLHNREVAEKAAAAAEQENTELRDRLADAKVRLKARAVQGPPTRLVRNGAFWWFQFRNGEGEWEPGWGTPPRDTQEQAERDRLCWEALHGGEWTPVAGEPPTDTEAPKEDE